MSGAHFELAWDGATCRLRDLESASGTEINGAPEKDAEVVDGDWIRAGATSFMVYVERTISARRRREPEAPEVVASKDAALAALRAEPDPLFAVLDAGRDARVLEILRRAPEDHRSLYDGIRGDALSEEAPYLAELPKDSWLLERLVREGWGQRWGMYLTRGRPFDEVRRHLRRFLLVEEEETRQELYFRFYDPGVLRVFVPTCTPRQRAAFFGEIGAFLVEGEQGEVVRFSAG